VLGKLKDLGNTVLGAFLAFSSGFHPWLPSSPSHPSQPSHSSSPSFSSFLLPLLPLEIELTLPLFFPAGKFGLNLDNFKMTEQPGGGYSMAFQQ
jgi:hypothetical protein